MKTCLSVALFALLAVPAFAQPNLPLEIPGMVVFIPWDNPGEWLYGTGVMVVRQSRRCPLCNPLPWAMDLNWIKGVPFLTEHQRFTPIWYSGVGAILIALSDGIIALVPSYREHADLIAGERWFSADRFIQWYLVIETSADNRNFIDAKQRGR